MIPIFLCVRRDIYNFSVTTLMLENREKPSRAQS
jgi:hypothetical protein